MLYPLLFFEFFGLLGVLNIFQQPISCRFSKCPILGARAPLELLDVKVKVKTAKKFLISKSLPKLFEVMKNC